MRQMTPLNAQPESTLNYLRIRVFSEEASLKYLKWKTLLH